MVIYAGFATIPPRYKMIDYTIMSLLQNNTPPNHIIVSTCREHKRFKEYKDHLEEIINILKKYGNRVTLVILEQDYGPSNKIMGPLFLFDSINTDKNINLVVCDDDIYYNSNLIKGYSENNEDNNKAMTYFKKTDNFKIEGKEIGHVQGADSYFIPASFFKKVTYAKYDKYLKYLFTNYEELFLWDDYLISLALHLNDIQVKNLPFLEYKCVHLIEELHHRPNINELEDKTVNILKNMFDKIRETHFNYE
jgi:hypothetical protein